VTKQGYWDPEERDVKVLSPLMIGIDPDDAEVGGNVRITVRDALGSPVSAEVEVTLPDGEMATVGDSYTTVVAGTHNVTARKAGYVTSTTQFTAEPHPLKLAAGLVGNRLIVNTTSNNSPVAGIVLSVEKPTGTEEYVTNGQGSSEIRITSEGLIKISANIENRNPMYTAAAISYRIEKKKGNDQVPNQAYVIALIALLILGAAYAILKLRGMEPYSGRQTGARPYFRGSGRASISRRRK